jgi:hypothetical protein
VLPGDASAYPSADVSEVTCVSTANCTALGTFTDAAGDIEGMTVTETHGVWARALTMAMPASAAPNPHTFFYGYGGLSCASTGNCSAGGQYLVGTSSYEGFFINEVDGTWQTATEMAMPAGAEMAGRNGGVVAVSCRSAGNCSAGAAYLDGSSAYQALVLNEVAGHWRAGQKITLADRQQHGRRRRRRLRTDLPRDRTVHRDGQLLEDADQLRGLHRHHELITTETGRGCSPTWAPSFER